jgi:hypothetical protein
MYSIYIGKYTPPPPDHLVRGKRRKREKEEKWKKGECRQIRLKKRWMPYCKKIFTLISEREISFGFQGKIDLYKPT